MTKAAQRQKETIAKKKAYEKRKAEKSTLVFDTRTKQKKPSSTDVVKKWTKTSSRNAGFRLNERVLYEQAVEGGLLGDVRDDLQKQVEETPQDPYEKYHAQKIAVKRLKSESNRALESVDTDWKTIVSMLPERSREVGGSEADDYYRLAAAMTANPRRSMPGELQPQVPKANTLWDVFDRIDGAQQDISHGAKAICDFLNLQGTMTANVVRTTLTKLSAEVQRFATKKSTLCFLVTLGDVYPTLSESLLTLCLQSLSVLYGMEVTPPIALGYCFFVESIHSSYGALWSLSSVGEVRSVLTKLVRQSSTSESVRTTAQSLLDGPVALPVPTEPLRLQLHRPVPIKQYPPRTKDRNPMSSVSSEHNSRKHIRRIQKKEKMGVRVTADVVREDQEIKESKVAAVREKKYNKLMSELQLQQNVMKTVDTHRILAKTKKKKK